MLLKDRSPAYITWQQYERNIRQLADNRNRALGVPRRGPALLAGLLRCGRCGWAASTTTVIERQTILNIGRELLSVHGT